MSDVDAHAEDASVAILGLLAVAAEGLLRIWEARGVVHPVVIGAIN